MEQAKPFWASWTLWGAVATFLGVILPNLGINVSPEKLGDIFHSWQQALDSILTFGGMIFTIYGRASATKQLSLSRGK